MLKNRFIVLCCVLLLLAACGDENDVEETERKTPFESIVLNDNHPMYLDDLESALHFAEQHSKKNIAVENVGGKSYSKYTDETIIIYKGYDNRGIITDIQIYLSKADEDIDLKKGLSVANDYLSSDFIKENYIIEDSYKIVPKDRTRKDVKDHIVIEYRMIDESKRDEASKQPITFYVMLELVDDKVYLVRIHTDKPNWMRRLEFNGYDKEDWDINQF
ncbi:hypothetical protein M3193_13225 [Sporosarcina luteola]|uniref:hypothetical protein n=1 Tax=Sporosarcina luteola TaxID=582850 RepID=UPI0020426408|nr:hypothetical protein [Sporosarcina luteola]MCM3745096.1 hypothetical protein [Sporosarcina luteola]